MLLRDFRDILESELAGLQDRLVPRAHELERAVADLQLKLNLVKDRLDPKDKAEIDDAWQQFNRGPDKREYQKDRDLGSGISGLSSTGVLTEEKLLRGVSFHNPIASNVSNDSYSAVGRSQSSLPHVLSGSLHSSTSFHPGIGSRSPRPSVQGAPNNAQGLIAQNLAAKGFEREVRSEVKKTHKEKRKKRGKSYVPNRKTVVPEAQGQLPLTEEESTKVSGERLVSKPYLRDLGTSSTIHLDACSTKGLADEANLQPAEAQLPGNAAVSSRGSQNLMPLDAYMTLAMSQTRTDQSGASIVPIGSMTATATTATARTTIHTTNGEPNPRTSMCSTRLSTGVLPPMHNSGREGSISINIPDMIKMGFSDENEKSFASDAKSQILQAHGEDEVRRGDHSADDGESCPSPSNLFRVSQYTMPMPAEPPEAPSLLSTAPTFCDDEYDLFEVLEEWKGPIQCKKNGLSRNGTAALRSLFDAEDMSEDLSDKKASTYYSKLSSDGHGPESVPFDRCMLLPNSVIRFFWDTLGMMFIVYDAIWLPLQFFHPPENAFTDLMSWVTRLFWSGDLLLNFRTGYITKLGEMEMRFKQVFLRYLLSWFVIDLIVVSSDWLEFLVKNGGEGVSAARFVKTFKIARTLRMIRLMRLMKLPGILHHFADEFSNKVRSEKMFLVGGVLKIMCFVVCFVHIIGCFWFLVGESDENDSWIIEHSMYNSSFAYQYMTSFHWSLSQLSGTMEVGPQNLGERIFAVGALLVAWMISASAVSVITTAMTRDSFFNIQGSMESVKLRKYLLEHCISRKLMARILRNASYAVAERTRNVTEDNLELLKLVSEPLRVELHFEVCSPILSSHPFFRQYKEVNPAAMRRTCHSAVTQVCLSPGDIMFSEGEAPTVPVMYILVSGTLKYWQGSFKPRWMRPGMWAAEANLWTSWLHQGYLRASTECNIVALGTKGFTDCDAHFALALADRRSHASKYAFAFVNEMNSCIHRGDLLTDLDCEELDVHTLCRTVFEDDNDIPRWSNPQSGSMMATAIAGQNKIRSTTQSLSRFVERKVSVLRRTTLTSAAESMISLHSVVPETRAGVDRVNSPPMGFDMIHEEEGHEHESEGHEISSHVKA